MCLCLLQVLFVFVLSVMMSGLSPDHRRPQFWGNFDFSSKFWKRLLQFAGASVSAYLDFGRCGHVASSVNNSLFLLTAIQPSPALQVN